MVVCPVCCTADFSVLKRAEELEVEKKERSEFIEERTTRTLSPGERKDLTDFFHNEKAELLECKSCSLLVREKCENPSNTNYSEEQYDPAAVEQIYPKYVSAFAAKEKPYRGLLPEGASVLELGSHYGAFLEVAGRWNWKATGVDVGGDSTRFARSRGLKVISGELQDCGFDAGIFDGFFVWNCFDQIEDPRRVLREASRILKPGGLLVIRTPNGFFYSLCQKLLQDPSTSNGGARFLKEAMAYNNLLGFPYQYGHSRGTLERLLGQFQFRPEGVLNSELLTLPLPEHPDWVIAEQREIQAGVNLLEHSVLQHKQGEAAGPWIELWFRSPETRTYTRAV